MVEVPDHILKATTKCPYKLSCITSKKHGDKPMCEVRAANGKNVLFLKDKEQANCPYRLTFANEQLCTCPTHYSMNCPQQENNH